MPRTGRVKVPSDVIVRSYDTGCADQLTTCRRVVGGPANTLRLSRAALLGADRTAARQPPRQSQTRPERTAADVTPVQVGSNRGRPGGRANERGRVGL